MICHRSENNALILLIECSLGASEALCVVYPSMHNFRFLGSNAIVLISDGSLSCLKNRGARYCPDISRNRAGHHRKMVSQLPQDKLHSAVLVPGVTSNTQGHVARFSGSVTPQFCLQGSCAKQGFLL